MAHGLSPPTARTAELGRLTRSHLLSSSSMCLCCAFLRKCCSRCLQRVPRGSRASSTYKAGAAYGVAAISHIGPSA